MNHYRYINNRTTPRELIFECDAIDILAADKLFAADQGYDVTKRYDIGCVSDEVIAKTVNL